MSYAKVAEYQARGLVHLHAVVRLDGLEGPEEPPPGWADLELLTDAIAAAHTTASLAAPLPASYEPIRYGQQIDVRPIAEFGTGDLTEQRVAGYIAKYATKGAEAAGTVDRPIRTVHAIPYLDVTDHARRMIDTCWLLAEVPAYVDLSLRRWSHMLGYRGHFLSKSRRYSVRFLDLRAARNVEKEDSGKQASLAQRAVEVSKFTYAGRGDNYSSLPWPKT